jgi:hypothetical protein
MHDTCTACWEETRSKSYASHANIKAHVYCISRTIAARSRFAFMLRESTVLRERSACVLVSTACTAFLAAITANREYVTTLYIQGGYVHVRIPHCFKLHACI